MKKQNFSRNLSLAPQESQAVHGRYIDVFVFMDDAQGSQRLYSGRRYYPSFPSSFCGSTPTKRKNCLTAESVYLRGAQGLL